MTTADIPEVFEALTLQDLHSQLIEVRRLVNELERQYTELARSHNEHDDQLDDHAMRLASVDGKLETIDLRFKTIRDELKSLALWRDRIEQSIEELSTSLLGLAKSQAENKVALENLINKATIEYLLAEDRDKKAIERDLNLNGKLNRMLVSMSLQDPDAAVVAGV